MSRILAYEKYKKGEPLTPDEAIWAFCHICQRQGDTECLEEKCPLYLFSHPPRKRRKVVKP